MRAYSSVAVFAILLIGSSSNLFGEEKNQLGKLHWILGDWTHTTEKATTTETWTDTGDGILKGHGVVTSTGDNNERRLESLLIVEMSGEVFYVAKVKENEFPVAFKLTSSSSSHAVFENATHDFPKQLEYRLGPNGMLNVTVSDGAKRSFVIPFSKSVRRNARNKGN